MILSSEPLCVEHVHILVLILWLKTTGNNTPGRFFSSGNLSRFLNSQINRKYNPVGDDDSLLYLLRQKKKQKPLMWQDAVVVTTRKSKLVRLVPLYVARKRKLHDCSIKWTEIKFNLLYKQFCLCKVKTNLDATMNVYCHDYPPSDAV